MTCPIWSSQKLATLISVTMMTPVSGHAQAKSAVPLGHFQGYFELVGRSDGDQPKLVDDIVELRTAPVIGLSVKSCNTGEGWLKYETVQNDRPILIGRLGREQIFCSFFSNAPDAPVLTCIISVKGSTEKPGRLLLWPVAKLNKDISMKGVCE